MAQKTISLNRMAVGATAIVYGVFVFLLVCMDLYLIGDYQKTRRWEEEQLLSGYVEQLHTDMEENNATFYDVFSNNRYFQALTASLSELEGYNNEHELNFSLTNRVMLEEWMHGFIIYYSGGEKTRYYMDTDRVKLGDIRTVKARADELLQEKNAGWHWIFMETDEHLYGLLSGSKGKAAFCIVYNPDWIEQSLAQEKGGRRIFYVCEGRMFGKEAPDELMEELPGELSRVDNSFRGYMDGSYICAQRVENTQLWVCMASRVTLFTYMNLPQLFLVLFTIGSLFFAWQLYRYMRRELVVPLRELGVVMNRIRDGEWEAVVEHGARFEEIQKINEALGVMMTEIKKQKLLSYEQTIEKQRAQMQYLQLQLKPHFYLNSLKTLNAFALNGESGRMQDLIMHLSYHLRYLLQAERELVPLSAEIDYVRNYEMLQGDMAGRRFSIDWTVQEDLGGWQVPTLCIQTFVENSFKYAKLGGMEKELIIWISVSELETEDGRFLDICVRDNGAGYPEHILEEINEEPLEGCVSVGINNLKRRCSLLYQGWVEYDFFNDEGAVSELILPFRQSGTEMVVTG